MLRLAKGQGGNEDGHLKHLNAAASKGEEIQSKPQGSKLEEGLGKTAPKRHRKKKKVPRGGDQHRDLKTRPSKERDQEMESLAGQREKTREIMTGKTETWEEVVRGPATVT